MIDTDPIACPSCGSLDACLFTCPSPTDPATADWLSCMTCGADAASSCAAECPGNPLPTSTSDAARAEQSARIVAWRDAYWLGESDDDGGPYCEHDVHHRLTSCAECDHVICARHGVAVVLAEDATTGYAGGTCYYADLSCGCTLSDETADERAAY